MVTPCGLPEMNKGNFKVMNKPLKLGVRLEPPAIVYIYSELNQMRMRVMPLRNIWSRSDTDFVLDDLQNRHGKYLKLVPKESIKKMINIIKRHKEGMKLEDILEKYESKISNEIQMNVPKNEGVNKTFNSGVNSTFKSKTDTTLFEINSTGTTTKLNHIRNSNEKVQFEEIRSTDSKKNNNQFSYPSRINKRSNVSFGKNDSSSDSEEFEYENNLNDLETNSDEELEINKFLRSPEIDKKNFLRNTSDHDIPESKARVIPSAESNMKSFSKNMIGEDSSTKLDDFRKKNNLKEPHIHNKIESANNLKAGRSEDDTDVEFDDSDIPLEEDFY